MHQLLPEVLKVVDSFLEGGESLMANPPISREWDHFVAVVKELDCEIEKEKSNILSVASAVLKSYLADAMQTKRNNDRALNGYLGAVCIGDDPKKFINIFLALEVLDCSVLITDDLFDEAEVRANKPAFHRMHGRNITITTALFLKGLSAQIIFDSRIEDGTKLRILREMEELHSKIYEGQLLDIQYGLRDICEITIEDYMNMISLTTGHQMAGGLKIGGILSSGGSQVLEDLGEIGLRIGLLGQIRDDLVDYLPDEKRTWKTPLLDFRNNRKRIPLLIGWRSADNQEKSTLSQLQRKGQLNADDYRTVLSIIMKPRNVEVVKEILENLRDEACKIIENSTFTAEGKRLLRAYISYGTS